MHCHEYVLTRLLSTDRFADFHVGTLSHLALWEAPKPEVFLDHMHLF